MDASKKKKKGNTPSKDDALDALELIKGIQKENDEDDEKRKVREENIRRQEENIAAEKARLKIIEEKIKRTLRENIKKKAIADQEKNITNFLESGNKIKWKSINGGYKLEGYFKNKLVCEIKRSLTLFSLYIKDDNIIKEKKIKSYQGCSMNIQKLKDKLEKII